MIMVILKTPDMGEGIKGTMFMSMTTIMVADATVASITISPVVAGIPGEVGQGGLVVADMAVVVVVVQLLQARTHEELTGSN
jgi:hypothetical protein